MKQGDEWWRPAAGSQAERRMNFFAAVLTIVGSSFALAALTWSLASTEDGRVKALLWWCFGVTALGGYLVMQITKRDHADSRYGRCLKSLHEAHHGLRDAAYSRYIAQKDEDEWKLTVEASLRSFARCMGIATGSLCHATIKFVTGPEGSREDLPASELIVETYLRSAERSPLPTATANTIGRNSDFRSLFSDDDDLRCWVKNDLLKIEPGLYDNPHWPKEPSAKNVPYRSTMVWPIRKVIQSRTENSQREVYIHGFLTVDSQEPDVFVFERHFDLGAAYADHLLSVLWSPEDVRRVHNHLRPEPNEVPAESEVPAEKAESPPPST